MKIQTTKVYSEIDQAVNNGFTTVSLQGSARSSKTYNAIIWLIIYCLNVPNTRLSIVRKTLPSIKGTVYIDFTEILMKMQLFDGKQLNKSEMTYHFHNGSWVDFFSTDDEQKLRGRKRDILFVNEANELSFIEFQQLKMRTSRFTIVDYNPSFSDEHWLCELNKDKRTYHFMTTYKDNPFLEQTIIDEIESLKEKNKSLWTIYGLGMQSQVEGLIFTNIEIIDEFPYWAKKQGLGIDYGYTNDQTAIVKCALMDDCLYLDEICYKTHMLAKDIIEVLKQYKDMEVMSESADPRMIQEISNAGIIIYPVNKFQGSVMAGINKMQEYKIKITKRSINGIKEAKNYTYMQNKDGAFVNMPIDKWNHFWDAARYWILGKLLGRVLLTMDYEKEELGIF